MKFKELRIMRLLTYIFNTIFKEEVQKNPRKTLKAKFWLVPKNSKRPTVEKKIGPRPYKRAKGNVSTDTTTFNHPRKDFHTN